MLVTVGILIWATIGPRLPGGWGEDSAVVMKVEEGKESQVPETPHPQTKLTDEVEEHHFVKFFLCCQQYEVSPLQ